jgi:hypothetical protein
MGRLRVSDFVHLRSLAWNLRLACRAGRYGDRCDSAIGAGCSPAPAWFCGEQELCGMERFRHFGPHRGREYRSARPAARSQFLRSCFNGSYGTAAAGSDILGADILDTALDCAVSGATSWPISNALPCRSHRHAPKSPRAGQTPCAVIQQIGNGQSGSWLAVRAVTRNVLTVTVALPPRSRQTRSLPT